MRLICRKRGWRSRGSVDLDDPPSEAAEDDVRAARAATRAQAMEQQAKLAGLDQQIVAKLADAAGASAEIEKLQASLPLTSEQTEIRRQLKEMEFGNKLAWLAAQQKLVEQQHDLPALIQRRAQAAAAAEALRRQHEQAEAEFEKSVLTELATAKQKAADFEKERDKAEQRLAFHTLKAPIDGTVQQLAIHTVGGVVTPAQALMVVVPDEARIVIEAHIPNQDVGFVRAGQPAQIKIETFNFTRYGLIDGKVLDVSRDSVATTGMSARPRNADREDEAKANVEEQSEAGGYIAHIALGRTAMMTEGGPVDLRPGMRITAEIWTGRRRVIDYLLSPVVGRASESLHER
jgi:hemolysin D